MTPGMIHERRRSPRLRIHASGELRIPCKHPVRLLDISLAGALVSSDVALPIGARGRLLYQPPDDSPGVKRVHVGRGLRQHR